MGRITLIIIFKTLKIIVDEYGVKPKIVSYLIKLRCTVSEEYIELNYSHSTIPRYTHNPYSRSFS